MGKELKSAIFGGSFNPVHWGHIRLAKEVLSVGYSQIIFVPASVSPHKKKNTDVSDEQRLQMLNIATQRYEWSLVWDGEIQRGGISFTIDTVRCLQKEKIINVRPGLIIGEDLISNFHTWKEAGILQKVCDIIIASRCTDEMAEQNTIFPDGSLKLNNPIWPYSSTQVRENIASGNDFFSMVPSEVGAYIVENGIYDCKR